MKMTYRTLAILPVLLLAACGSQFNDIKQTNTSAIRLGVSSIEDVKSHLSGGRQVEDDITINGKTIHYLNFAHVKSAMFFGMEAPTRYLTYLFYDGKLVGIEKSSRFDEDSTKFDIDKAKTIKDGVTREQIVSLLGQPSGEFIYPIAKNPGDTGIAYYNVIMMVEPFVGGVRTVNEARYSLNDHNEVDDVSIDDDKKFDGLTFKTIGTR